MKIMFVKAHFYNGKKRFVGTRMRVDAPTAESLLGLGVAEEYKGIWPPLSGRKGKTKINIRNLK